MQRFEEYNHFIQSQKNVGVYLSHDECNVCKVLKPKIQQLLQEKFPKIQFHYINVKETPEIAAQLSVFTVPVFIVYLDGNEFIRKSRNIGLYELENDLARPYGLFINFTE